MFITFSFGIVSIQFASGQAALNVQNISAKKAQVGDINIAYKTFRKGDPILLISGGGSAWILTIPLS